MKTVSRRRFLKGAGLAAIAVPNIITSSALGANGRPPASERLVVAGIGMGGRGSSVLNEFMGNKEVQVVAVCDVKSDSLAKCKGKVDGKYKTRYRSEGALHITDSSKLHHEHVFEKKHLIDSLLEDPDSYKSILDTAIGCVVTREEHALLTSL